MLAGGKAERLGEAAGGLPKALVPVGGRPLLAWQIGRLREAGVERVIVSCFGGQEDEFDTRLAGVGVEIVCAGEPERLGRKVDWVTKKAMIERYMAKHDLSLASPRIALLDLSYHDVNRSRGLFYLLERAGKAERVVTDAEVNLAMREPPQTTRAKLRGDFIKQAKAKRRDYTVDWVHLKLNDQAQRTVLCKDPFRSVDERVEQLIAHM